MNVSSTTAYQPVPSLAVYAAAKAFVLSFSQSLWYEARQHGVTVFSFAKSYAQAGLLVGYSLASPLVKEMREAGGHACALRADVSDWEGARGLVDASRSQASIALPESRAEAQFVHLRLVLGGSELALLPFEMARAPAAMPGEGKSILDSRGGGMEDEDGGGRETGRAVGDGGEYARRSGFPRARRRLGPHHA